MPTHRFFDRSLSQPHQTRMLCSTAKGASFSLGLASQLTLPIRASNQYNFMVPKLGNDLGFGCYYYTERNRTPASVKYLFYGTPSEQAKTALDLSPGVEYWLEMDSRQYNAIKELFH